MGHTEYFKLKQEVILCVGNIKTPSQLLNNLKELFRDDINSPRKFEQITTIGQLLNILETRDMLSENDISPIRKIVQYIPNNSDLLQRIRDYEMSPVPEDFTNHVYENMSIMQDRQAYGNSLPRNNNAHIDNTDMSIKKKQMIIETVIEDIGSFWKDLARSLEIKEKKIDETNENYKTTVQKAACILDMYLRNCLDDQSWFHELYDALETSRRRDLAKKIKKIYVTK